MYLFESMIVCARSFSLAWLILLLSLVDQRAAADVDDGRGQRAGQIRGSEDGRVTPVLERRGPPEQRLSLDHPDDPLATLEALGKRLGHTAAGKGDEPDPVPSKLDRELAPHRLDRVEGDLCPAQVIVAYRPA